MRPSTLLSTKFAAPPARDHLRRPQLIQWLEGQSERRLILVSAPPGYGKTSLLAEFIHGLEKPVAWYQLEPSDSDPAVFLSHLIESIRRAAPAGAHRLGRNARSLLESGDGAADPRRLLTLLINDLAEHTSDPFLIVLDDYHFVASPVIHQLIDFFLENAPPNLQTIISTRTDPPLPLGRWRARGLLAELRTMDLRFRDDEISALLRRDAPRLSSESLGILSEKTEGWPAALQIVRNSLVGQGDDAAREIIAGLSGSHRFVFQYLAEEVFRRQSAGIQQFLLRTSILDQMDAASCAAVTGAADSQGILEALERRNLFVTSLDSERRWFRYHNLFREFLMDKLQREGAIQLARLQGQVARYYEDQCEWELAFSHYLSASRFERAARVAARFAADYVERGRVEVLLRYLNSLPAEVLRSHPELLLELGNAHRRLGEAGLAANEYEDARHIFEQQNNAAGRSQALTRLAELHRALGDYRQAASLAAQGLEAAPSRDHTSRAEALMALAKSTGFISGMDKGQELAEQAVTEARRARGLSGLARAGFLQSLGQICWWHGDPQSAVRYAQEALSLAPEELSPAAAQACILLATPHLYWRELDAALEYAERGLRIAQTLHLHELLPAAYTALGNVLTRRGEIARAEAALRQSVDLAQRLGIASYELLMATGYLAYNLYGQGRVDEAWQLAEGALWVYRGGQDTYEAFVCRSVLADVALENDEPGRAEALFNELLQSGQRRQFRIPLAMVHFGLAYVHLVTERRETGLEHARLALELIEPTRAIQLFIDQGERSRLVCRALIDAGHSSPFLDRVLQHLPDLRQKRIPAVAADPSAISIHTLGTFRVFVGGQEISQERWVSTKARDLLAYFITFRRERIPADRAFEAIWSEKTGRGIAAFHTALSRLRSALRAGQDSPRLILGEAGEYRLDPARFSMDVDEFDAALAKARVSVDAAAAARLHEQAVNLYNGEYLQNLYYDWLLPERRRLIQAYIGSLRLLAEFHYSHARYTHSLELIERALRVDSLQEELHCQAMRMHAALGDRAALVQQYQEMRRILARELDMEPLHTTERLYQKLLEKIEA